VTNWSRRDQFWSRRDQNSHESAPFFLKKRKFQKRTENEIEASNSFLSTQNILETLFSPKNRFILRRSTRKIPKTSRLPRSAFVFFLVHFFYRISAGCGALVLLKKSQNWPIERFFGIFFFHFFYEIFSMCFGHAVTNFLSRRDQNGHESAPFFLKKRKFQKRTENEIEASNSFLSTQNILETLFSPKNRFILRRSTRKIPKTSRVPRSAFVFFLVHFF